MQVAARKWALRALPVLLLLSAGFLWVVTTESTAAFVPLNDNQTCFPAGGNVCASTCMGGVGTQCATPYGAGWSNGSCGTRSISNTGCYGFLLWSCGDKQDCTPQRNYISACPTPNLCS